MKGEERKVSGTMSAAGAPAYASAASSSLAEGGENEGRVEEQEEEGSEGDRRGEAQMLKCQGAATATLAATGGN